MDIRNPYFPSQANTWSQTQKFQLPGKTNYSALNWNGHTCVGVFNPSNSLFYGIFAGLPSPSGATGIGGYYNGVGVGGSSNGTGSPIFGVLTSSQSSSGIGHTAFTVYDNNEMVTFNNVLDDGKGNRRTSPGTTDLAGTTAGNIYWAQPEQGTRKVFIAVADAYENDTTTNQTITFPTAYTYTPAVATNTTGLTVSASTTALTITAPNSTTTYSGVIEVIGI